MAEGVKTGNFKGCSGDCKYHLVLFNPICLLCFLGDTI